MFLAIHHVMLDKQGRIECQAGLFYEDALRCFSLALKSEYHSKAVSVETPRMTI